MSWVNVSTVTPLEFVFQEQSYSNLHSGWSLAWGHFRLNITNPCGIITNFCGVIADPCVARITKHHKTLLNVVKHYETLVKHCETPWTTIKTSWTTSKTSWNTFKTLWNIMKHSNTCHSMRRYRHSMRRHRCSCGVSGNIGDRSVGITLQMCNRVTNHGDMGTFSKQAQRHDTGAWNFGSTRQAANSVCIHEWSKIQYVNKSIVKRSLIGLSRWVIGPLMDLSGFHCSYDISRWQRKYQLSNDHKIRKCFGN